MSAGLAATPSSPASEELRRAAAVREGLSSGIDRDVIDAYLVGLEQSLEARVDARLQGARPATPRFWSGVSGRLAISLGIGLPLTIPIAAIAGEHGSGVAAMGAIIATLATILTLNIYYTENEKALEKERRRHP